MNDGVPHDCHAINVKTMLLLKPLSADDFYVTINPVKLLARMQNTTDNIITMIIIMLIITRDIKCAMDFYDNCLLTHKYINGQTHV